MTGPAAAAAAAVAAADAAATAATQVAAASQAADSPREPGLHYEDIIQPQQLCVLTQPA